MKLLAFIAYMATLATEIAVLERVGLDPHMRDWWAIMFGYIGVGIFGVIMGGES